MEKLLSDEGYYITFEGEFAIFKYKKLRNKQGDPGFLIYVPNEFESDIPILSSNKIFFRLKLKNKDLNI